MPFTNLPKVVVLLTTLLVVLALNAPAAAEAPGDKVLSRYPTRERLQRRIDEAKVIDPQSFESARKDFGTAIRLSRSVQGPPWPGKPDGIPIIAPKPTLYALRTPAQWENVFRRVEEKHPGSDWTAFYRERMSDLTIDDSVPVLKYVLIDVVLNGWHDWDQWTDPSLIELRSAFPLLHRVYAIRELRRLEVREVGGVLLELYIQPDTPEELLIPVWDGVKDLVDAGDTLELVLSTYLQSDDPEIRTRMEPSIPGFSSRAGKSQRARDLWRPYLESEVPLLRFEARKAFDLAVPDFITCNDLQERWVAENDPDPDRRRLAATRIKNRETANAARQGLKPQ